MFMNILIEKFLLFPDSLSDSEKVKVQELLKSSVAANLWHSWLKQYYAEFKNQKNGSHFLKQIPVSVFVPMNIFVDSEPDYGLRMAAKTDGYAKKHVFTLISDDQKTAVRVFRDEALQLVQLYLISAEIEPYQIAIRMKLNSKLMLFGPSAVIQIPFSELTNTELLASDFEIMHS